MRINFTILQLVADHLNVETNQVGESVSPHFTSNIKLSEFIPVH